MLLLISTLIISIFIHESGHFIAAKLCGCGVEVFSIGFFKPILWEKMWHKTLFQIRLWLFGGYCQLKGETSCSRAKNAFSNLPYRKKAIILVAGCAVNLIFGGLALIIGMQFGNYPIYYFGILNIVLGLTNLLPIPALDGSLLALVWLVKFYGKKRGNELMNKICHIGFIALTILNIACIPYVIYLWMKGMI